MKLTADHDPAGQSPGTADRSGATVRSPSGEHVEVVARSGPVKLQRAPKVPAEAREELLVIKDSELFLCASTDGDVTPAQVSGEGFYAYDTRFLSEIRLEVGGAQPVALSYSTLDGRAMVDATNAELVQVDSDPIPQMSLSITRELAIAAGRLYYLVRVRNFTRRAVATTATLTLGADFADMFEVRGGVHREARGHALAPRRTGDGFVLAYVGEDEVFRESVVELRPAPEELVAQADQASASWRLLLDPGTTAELLMSAEPSIGGRRRRPRRLRTATAQLARAEAEWKSACTKISTDDERVDAVIARSVRDLRALTTSAAGGQMVSAGIPWYVAPFGRDALITAGEAMLLNPSLSLDALRVLHRLQAKRDDAWRDAEPGKILHELRVGELAGAGIIPHTPYYGTADATPLFLIRAADYFAWTADLATLQALMPALDAALTWIDAYGDGDNDGFVEYERRSPAGLRNQGWKDSSDCIVHADGTLAEGPIALVEVQAYVYQAKLGIANVYEALGQGERAATLRSEADSLRRQFNEAFWNPVEGTYALALDGRKQQVASVTSNAGHALCCGIADPDKAGAVVRRLMAADMFCGWGVRTLSSDCPAFNPMSYHNGSVWPHDNAIIASGMKRYGYDREALRIAGAIFDVATTQTDSRLPELYCGFDRSERATVVGYPVACIPQAWAAAAPLYLVQTMLGISADAPNGALRIVRPTLPDWLGLMQVEDLHVGEATVSLAFERADTATAFTLSAQEGALEVTMAAGDPRVARA